MINSALCGRSPNFIFKILRYCALDEHTDNLSLPLLVREPRHVNDNGIAAHFHPIFLYTVLGFILTGFVLSLLHPACSRDKAECAFKGNDMAEDIKTPSPFEKRVDKLIAQCTGIPPGEVMQLLLTADRDQAVDLEKALQELREKYNDKK